MQLGSKKDKKSKKGKKAWSFVLFAFFVSTAPFAMKPDFKNVF
jgi:hypothetical protein